MCKHKEYRDKLMAEIRPPLDKIASQGGCVFNEFDYDSAMELEYLQHCYYESLRIEPPASLSFPMLTTEDITIGSGPDKLNLVKDTKIMTMAQEIHHDPEEWREHLVYNPDRFNKDSEWFLRPDGKPRNPLSFTPFLGGRRICVGKTFAEIIIRFTVPYLYHFCDFEFVNHEK